MPHLSALPKELLTLIVSFVDSQKALSSLSQTCKILHKITEPLLYESVSLTGKTAPSFATGVSESARRKNIVKTIRIECDDNDHPASPCTYAPIYAELPSLEVLSFRGGYWHWDDDKKYKREGARIVLWRTDQKKLQCLFEQASLAQPVHERIWTKLRSLRLDLSENNGQGWFCVFEPVIFLIPSLEELRLRGCRFTDEDGKDLVSSPYRGQTGLKKLVLERSYIHHTAVFNFLHAPKALTHLTLEHDQWMCHHEMGNDSFAAGDSREWMEAFMPQKHSLQFLCVNDQLALQIDEESEQRVFDFEGFPELREIRCEGECWVVESEKCVRPKNEDDWYRERIEEEGRRS